MRGDVSQSKLGETIQSIRKKIWQPRQNKQSDPRKRKDETLLWHWLERLAWEGIRWNSILLAVERIEAGSPNGPQKQGHQQVKAAIQDHHVHYPGSKKRC